ncbi:MAG: nucleotide exchange factor GrpE [Planctomycetota bacterium]|nr:MAG: nucleotide exchange factor GrpE [Planctomycetota bacterium]
MPKDRKKKREEEAAARSAPAAAGTPPEQTVEYWRDKALRAQAEMVNVRRRAEQEIDERARLRLEGVLADLIQLADALELALAAMPAAAHTDPAARPVLDGWNAIRDALAQLLARQGVEMIQPGPAAAFDPELHEAVLVTELPGAPEPRLELLRRGYRLGRRILRPAQVHLLRPGATAAPPAPEDGTLE